MPYDLNEELAARRAPLSTTAEVDAVTAGIIRGAFETTCFEVCEHIRRTAVSAMINTSSERNATILDGNGRIAGLSIGVPQLLFISALPVRYAMKFVEEDDWGPGDVFVGNDPNAGGGHLPDYNVFAPVFGPDGEVLFVQAIQAHQGDTGGKDPGGFSADALDLWAEGLIIPRIKLLHRGEPRRDVLDLITRNNRLPDFRGDLWSMIGGAQLGAGRIQEIVDEFGAEATKAATNFNVEMTERRFRENVSGWPDGCYRGTVLIDADPAGHEDIRVHVECRVEGDQITVDLTGTDDRPELQTVWNTFANTRGYAVAQLASMVDPTIPKNEGLFNAIEIIAPEGSVVNPPDNKPVALGAFHPAVEVGEAICLALSPVVPDRASPQVYKIGLPPALYGFDESGQMWLDPGVDTRASDNSAVEGIDGWGALCSGLGNLIMGNAEENESRFPVRHVSRQLVTDTVGPGRWRGQAATLNVKECLAEAFGSSYLVSVKYPLRGVLGGSDATPYGHRFFVGTDREFSVEGAIFNVPVRPGDVMAYQFGGGAGFGDPLERDPELVRLDVLDELISMEAARRDYAVALTGSVENLDVEVDHETTKRLRAKREVED